MTLQEAIRETAEKWAHKSANAPNAKPKSDGEEPCPLCKYAGNVDMLNDTWGMPLFCGRCPIVSVFGRDPDGRYGCSEAFEDIQPARRSPGKATNSSVFMTVLLLAEILGVRMP